MVMEVGAPPVAWKRAAFSPASWASARRASYNRPSELLELWHAISNNADQGLYDYSKGSLALRARLRLQRG